MNPVRHRALFRFLVAALPLFSATTQALAFEQCPAGTSPCASLGQVVFYGLLPSAALLILALYARRRIRRPWLRRVSIALIGAAWCLGVLVLLAAFGAFLAPCTSACWYHP